MQKKPNIPTKDNMGILSILCKAKYTKKNKEENENKPATIRRPGAETKVGGFPLTTMGFKAPPVIWLQLFKEAEQEGSESLREWEGEGGGNGARQSEAIAWAH